MITKTAEDLLYKEAFVGAAFRGAKSFGSKLIGKGPKVNPKTSYTATIANNPTTSAVKGITGKGSKNPLNKDWGPTGTWDDAITKGVKDPIRGGTSASINAGVGVLDVMSGQSITGALGGTVGGSVGWTAGGHAGAKAGKYLADKMGVKAGTKTYNALTGGGRLTGAFTGAGAGYNTGAKLMGGTSYKERQNKKTINDLKQQLNARQQGVPTTTSPLKQPVNYR